MHVLSQAIDALVFLYNVMANMPNISLANKNIFERLCSSSILDDSIYDLCLKSIYLFMTLTETVQLSGHQFVF